MKLPTISFEIIDVEKSHLNESEVREVAEIEAHPEVSKWDDDPIGDPDNLASSIQRFKGFFDTSGENRICLLARLEGEIIGFLAIGRLPSPTISIGNISIMVHPDHQNRGVATKLLKEGIRLSREKDYDELEAGTLEKNMAMRRVAEKNGFYVEDIRICSWREGEREVVFRLML